MPPFHPFRHSAKAIDPKSGARDDRQNHVTTRTLQSAANCNRVCSLGATLNVRNGGEFESCGNSSDANVYVDKISQIFEKKRLHQNF